LSSYSNKDQVNPLEQYLCPYMKNDQVKNPGREPTMEGSGAPFDELWTEVTTIKVKLDRSIKDQLDDSTANMAKYDILY
jgi:hypothetical protein